MKPHIAKKIVLRTPKFSWKATLADCWEELKTDIAISSPDFFATIAHVGVDELSALPEKVRYTIWKYFNRARFRATPFGTFGGFGIAEISTEVAEDHIQIENQFSSTSFTDWPFKNTFSFDTHALLDANVMLFANSSYYVTSSSLRFVSANDKTFELSEVQLQDVVLKVLEICGTPTTVDELIDTIVTDAVEIPDLKELLADMIDLQLLFTEKDANIIGEDYFRRINKEEQGGKTPYIISKIEGISGALSAQKFRHLPEAVSVLQNIISAPVNDSLDRFISAFTLKFEQREVPIMVALDPEIGVGYDDLEQGGSASELLRQLVGKQTSEVKNKSRELLSLISKELEEVGGSPIDSIALDKLAKIENNQSKLLPNSFSVVGQLSDELFFVENIGGTTANSLNGRFTLADEPMLTLSREIAKEEADANGDIVFFDVGYMSEGHVDNINRRRAIYPYHLSILNFDTSERPLNINDIFLSVRGREVILRSAKLNKRIVPRLASAYNYSRSDLSLFRLLCDLQNQGLHSYLSFSVEKILPGRTYYPQIKFKNIVLSPRKWHIKADSFALFTITAVRTFLLALNISRYFKAGVSDQMLCFCLDSDEDIGAFIIYLKKHKDFFVEEAGIPITYTVTDSTGSPYLGQIILHLKHPQKIYHGFSSRGDIEETNALEKVFPPGTDWIYFELYCHNQRSDLIVGNYIPYLIERHKDKIETWFFIRYNHPTNHVRLRIKLKSLEFYQPIVTNVYEILAKDIADGLVSELSLKTYKRELARYGSANIEAVERHFCADSEYVISVISSGADDFQKYRQAIALGAKIGETVFAEANFIDIVRQMSDSFNNEHNLDTGDFKRINSLYQDYTQSTKEVAFVGDTQLFIEFTNSLIHVLNNVIGKQKGTLFSDLFHMHVNRLFSELPRTHEMIIYYFMLKDLQKAIAIKKVKLGKL